MTLDQCIERRAGPDELIEVARSLAATGAIDLLQRERRHRRDADVDRVLRARRRAARGRLQRARAALRARRSESRSLVAGRIVDARDAPSVRCAGGVDLVAMTRAIIADPDLPAKAARRASRPALHRTERGLHRPPLHGRPMWCSVNPGVREPGAGRARPRRRAGAGRRRRAAAWPGWRRRAPPRSRGHAVVLFERRAQLGGRARLAGARRGRERWALYLDWLRGEAEAAGAELRTGVAATAEGCSQKRRTR